MSASVDQQRSNGVTNGAGKESEVNYTTAQSTATAEQYTTASSTVDMYGMMASYYPYYSMPQDMTAVGSAYSSVDPATAAAYGYSSDYGTMMADYSYGYGWYPSVDASVWGGTASVPGAVKDDLGNTYNANGYYAVEAMPVYNGAEAVSADGMVSSVEQAVHSLNINDGSASHIIDESAENGSIAVNGASGGMKTWAAVAGQPVTYRLRNTHNGYYAPQSFGVNGGWESREFGRQAHEGWSASRRRANARSSSANQSSTSPTSVPSSKDSAPIPLASDGQYNPKEFDLSPKGARFFIIKSYAEDDIHRSIKYGIWCSTDYGNKRLDAAFREREGKGPLYLFFSVNGSGHFCGIAQMMSPVDYQSSVDVWAENKWKGKFTVKWIYVKDVPNSQLRHIRLENNEGKPVTNSRDTQEVPPEKGCQVLRIIHQYRHTTSIFDDFSHYEKLQDEAALTQN